MLLSCAHGKPLPLAFWLQIAGAGGGGVTMCVCVPLWSAGRLTCRLWCQHSALFSPLLLAFALPFASFLAYYATVTEAELSFPLQ